MFPAQTYTRRRERLQAAFRDGLLLFLGNEESPMNYADNTFHFRQDSTFLYLMGVDQPGWAAVIDVDAGTTTAFANDLDLDAIVWTGVLPTVAELARGGGITRTAPAAALGDVVTNAKAQGRTIRFLPPYRPESALKLFRMLGVHPDEAKSQANVELVRAVVEMRAHKDAEEIAEIETAVDTTVDMHLAAMAMAKPGLLEADIAARVTEIALAAGGNLSFPVIATIHGETLHNHSHTHRLEPGRLFLLDAGAETALHYAGDLTSTFPVDRSFTPRQKEIYDVVLAAHVAAVKALTPGVPFRDVHLLGCRTLSEGLKGLGLMKGDINAAVEQGAHAMFFQCGLGHMMGLDVHDMEDLGEQWVGYEGQPHSTQFGLKSLRLARPIEPGFVFTVEPGVYIIPELIDRWKAEGKFREFLNYDTIERYRDFGGIRIEENFVVRERDCRRLGKDRPRTTSEVEALR
ncbi:MAG: Xaa-Pro aminopeptidase [Acidobacteria bacterium RIFCSPLOWO2_02_FULL_67_36]|nr:MAG: Xaa-Pro aminopeptidase [Acidobacteria bacterium RIFCSPLOWO2_02_FULL_67_36]OFW22669.1 MAG: Xaa-Pro aminopeptidase [Acidobacteria bacterium RIFCSPLOWO2_12_FULL_66_21]